MRIQTTGVTFSTGKIINMIQGNTVTLSYTPTPPIPEGEDYFEKVRIRTVGINIHVETPGDDTYKGDVSLTIKEAKFLIKALKKLLGNGHGHATYQVKGTFADKIY